MDIRVSTLDCYPGRWTVVGRSRVYTTDPRIPSRVGETVKTVYELDISRNFCLGWVNGVSGFG